MLSYVRKYFYIHRVILVVYPINIW